MDFKYIITKNENTNHWGVYQLIPSTYLPVLVELFDKPEEALNYLQTEL